MMNDKLSKSTLIRFTSSEFVDSYLSGELWLSSLNNYWDFLKGKIDHKRFEMGQVSDEEMKRALKYAESRQQDFSEGAAMQVKRDIMNDILGMEEAAHIIHDVRFRIHAYRFVNLLCFYRIDCLDGIGEYTIDDENVFSLACDAKKGNIKELNDVLKLSIPDVLALAGELSERNELLNPNQYHIVQLPPPLMDDFGDVVVVIKDETAFVDTIIEAVRKQGGDVITGNVRYHNMIDRLDPSTEGKNHVTLIDKPKDGELPIFDAKKILNGREDVIHLGCLDKYAPYSFQKEWRVCWLPKVYNTQGKILHCGSLKDIIDIVETKDIRRYLLKKYQGYVPGVIQNFKVVRNSRGSISYRKFIDKVENIDGMCSLIYETGG